MPAVFVAGYGLRPADGLRMSASPVIEQDERALKVLDVSTTEVATDVAFEIRDDNAQTACLAGTLEHDVLGRAPVSLRDENGTEYPRSDNGENGMSIGQHEFGFFGRRVAFERLPAHARRVTLGVRGALGEWDVPIDLAPIAETGAIPVVELDASATVAGITVRLLRAAFADDQTFIELAATTTRERASIAGIGEMQRDGDEKMVIVDGAGHRYVEELSRETVRRPRQDRTGAYAKLPPLPTDADGLTLVVRSVLVEDSEPQLDVALPLDERKELRYGRYALLVGPAHLADDLPNVPGKSPRHGLRVVVGPVASANEHALRPTELGIDGDAKKWGWGWGWHPEPGMRNLTIDVAPEVAPRSIRLQGALVRISGPWEIRFSRPR